jgi:hypothetical protein
MLEDHLKPRISLWLHIAAGVCVGMLTAAFLIWRVAVVVIEQEAAKLADARRQIAETAQRERTMAARDQAQSAESNRQRLAEAERASESEEARRRAEADRRELAWTRYYAKPPACDETKGGTWSVACANDYIRARKKFADEYAAGKL